MPKGNSGIKRGRGITGTTAPAPEQTSAARTVEVSGTALDLSDSKSIERLREMASRGEVPYTIEAGGIEGRERFYEEFDRLYPNPPGILNDYRVEGNGGRTVDVYFNYNMAEAESPGQVRLPSRNSSESVRNGAIKYAIYRQRPAVELALASRHGGYASFEMSQKYGKRLLSDSEKAQADREIASTLERLLGSPMSQRGVKANQDMWKRESGGWKRAE